MTRRHQVAAALAVLLAAVLTACAHAISGTATWPGAKLERVVLTAADFPPDVQYDRINGPPGQPDGAGGRPTMLSNPEGCSDGLTRAIADSAERGPGSAAEYVVGYDGARIVMTVLTWRLDLASSVYFTFENIGGMAVFGIAFPTPNPSIAVKAALPQTFLDIAAKQAERARSA